MSTHNEPSKQRWRGTIAVEGQESRDRRLVTAHALTWTTPIPLMSDSSDPFTGPIVGMVHSIRRLDDGGGRFLLEAEGALLHAVSGSLDLSISVDKAGVRYRDDGVMVFAAARVMGVRVGLPAIWPECVLVMEGELE